MPMETTVADRLRAVLPDLPAAERRVARVLLNNYPVAGLETVARVAKKSGTSGPTVLRLATRLGMSGYSELQQALRDELEVRERSPLMAYGAQRPHDEDIQATAAALLGQAVTASVTAVERADFDHAVKLLVAPKARLFVTGGRFSGVAAEYLVAHLQQLRPGVSVVRSPDFVPTLLDLGRRDVVVAFDLRRYQADVVGFGRSAADRGAKVILITDPWMSPLSRQAEVVLSAEVSAPSPFDSLVPCMALVETLVAGIVDVLGDEPRRRIAAYDESWARQFGTIASHEAQEAPEQQEA
ncbi:MurR/RpiR family transcriptional regulator [Streptomyces coffeae]|nr:MurR/RpiR family transcriptional regulator [Streptomyces coffeae]